MSIDTGMAGNLFAGQYFSMNKDHLDGNLPKIQTNFKQIEKKRNPRSTPPEDEQYQHLKIKPLSDKKRRVIRSWEDTLVDEGKKKEFAWKVKKEDDVEEEYDPTDPDGLNKFYSEHDE